MRQLRMRGMVEPLSELVLRKHKPILGICLGAQLIARDSEEFGHHEGLGWIAASVRRIETNEDGLRIPHMGWNELFQTGKSVLFDDVPDASLFYYVHSFRLVVEDRAIVIGECDYGGRFSAAVQSGNIYATQFHPEKSQRHGLTLLSNYLAKA
jgi:glutamine amidotransferase